MNCLTPNLCKGLLLVALLPGSLARADDISDARAAGLDILLKLEQGKVKETWDTDVSSWFKDQMTRDAFLANMAFTRAQLGAPSSSRVLIQQMKADALPVYSYKGSTYSFMFKTVYPAANFYENVILVREGDRYKVFGLTFLPNPN